MTVGVDLLEQLLNISIPMFNCMVESLKGCNWGLPEVGKVLPSRLPPFLGKLPLAEDCLKKLRSGRVDWELSFEGMNFLISDPKVLLLSMKIPKKESGKSTGSDQADKDLKWLQTIKREFKKFCESNMNHVDVILSLTDFLSSHGTVHLWYPFLVWRTHNVLLIHFHLS
jgi:hypothetical protein